MIIDIIDEICKPLYDKKKYTLVADLLVSLLDSVAPEYRQSMLDNAVHAYFSDCQIQKAFDALLDLEKYPHDWRLEGEKVQYMRYLCKYEEGKKYCLEMPERPEKWLLLGWFMLQEGKFKESFAMTERSRHGAYWFGNKPILNLPVWDGKDTDGNLVIAGESGSGDEIIFARWIPEIKKKCNKLYYYCNNSLMEVFEREYGILKFERSDSKDVVAMVPSMSIPYILKKESAGTDIYLTSIKELVDQLNTIIPKKGIRIGINYTGEETHAENHLRRIPLTKMVEAFGEYGELVNLQKNHTEPHDDVKYIDLPAWDHTLAVIDSCDLIITVCTSTAHAAGALGKKTIVLSCGADYFTWCDSKNMGKSSWYKDVWCIRQATGNWDEALNNARILLKEIL